MGPVPPASRNGFEYYNNDFYVVIPPYNRHRRCTVPELHDLLCSPGSASVKDKPAHWYRAQLIHYGLRPTDNKGTAVMRLLDAVRLGDLEVPDHLVKLEENLRREWQKNFRKMQKSTERGSTTKATAKDIDRTRTTLDQIPPKQKGKQSQDLKARTVGPDFAVPALPFSDNKDYYTGANAKSRAQSYETQKRIEGGIKYTSASSTSPSKKQDNLRAGYEETRVSQDEA
jgi:hypothetical protein